MSAPQPTPLYTGDEMVERWNERAKRWRTHAAEVQDQDRHDEACSLHIAHTLESCAAELAGALAAARGEMVTCDRLPGTPHVRLYDDDDSLGCLEPVPITDDDGIGLVPGRKGHNRGARGFVFCDEIGCPMGCDEVCAGCRDAEHAECERPVVVSPPSYSSADGLAETEHCCCGAIRDLRP